MMPPFETPTELRIKKALGGYLLEMQVDRAVTLDPVTMRPNVPCGPLRSVRGMVFSGLDEALEAARKYLEEGHGCGCGDCDHA